MINLGLERNTLTVLQHALLPWLVCRIGYAVHSQRKYNCVHYNVERLTALTENTTFHLHTKMEGVYTHIAQVHGHFVMYLHLSSALLCLLQQLRTNPTTTCAKEIKEVVQSMFCRRLTIGHTNNFLTSNQSGTTCLYLLPHPQTCQSRQAHSGIQWCPHEEHLQVHMSISFRNPLGLS